MYPSNLSDQEWSEIEHFFRRSDPRGAKSIHSKHAIVNAVLYVVKSGCQWRILPHDFLPGKPFMIIIAAGIKEGFGKRFWITSMPELV